MPNFTEVFLEFQNHINNDQNIREIIKNIVKNIEQTSRELNTVLQVIHNDESRISEACGKARELFGDVRTGFEQLAGVFPIEDYYRYRDHWRYLTQRLCFSAALVVWLEVGILISRDTAASILGIKASEDGSGFHLDIEDFLMGLLELSSELARLAVNSVTRGDYSKPIQISHFVMEMNAGFRLLNLKNDSLRKRFDVLKYDVKKIEEVVYDLSIRGLNPATQNASEGNEPNIA